MERLGSEWTDFPEICFLSIFRKYVEKIQVSLKFDKITGSLNEDECTYIIISRPILLRMRNVSEKMLEGK